MNYVLSICLLLCMHTSMHSNELAAILTQDKPEADHRTFNNIGYVLKKLGYVQQAIEFYRRAITMNPDYALAHLNLGIAYLALGDFQQGLPEYEWRFAAYLGDIQLPQPQWDGSCVQGKRICVDGEQGFGDIFQYIRYLEKLKADGAYLIFRAPAPVTAVLRLCPYIDQVATYYDEVPACDYHIPVCSLPLHYKTTIDTIPAAIPYLYADPILIQYWSDYFASMAQGGLKIGICWHGNLHYEDQALQEKVKNKSCTVADFSIIAALPGVILYNLQKIDEQERLDIADVPWLHLFDDSFDELHGRFMDSAAVIKNLDLVITVDTAIAHFAAALGTPTWVILPHEADWRWMYDRTDSPWYPNVRLFRQKKQGDWSELMRQVVRALRKKVKRTAYSVEQAVADHIQDLHVTKRSMQYDSENLAIAYAVQHDLAQCNS